MKTVCYNPKTLVSLLMLLAWSCFVALGYRVCSHPLHFPRP